MGKHRAYLDQKCNKSDRHQIGLPVCRKAVCAITSRCRARESVGRSGCNVGVERRGKNRGRGINGQWDGGGNEDVTNRVCGVILWGIQERGEDAIVRGVKEVDQDDGDGDGDMIDIHGGQREDVESERGKMGVFIYPWNTGVSPGQHSEKL